MSKTWRTTESAVEALRNALIFNSRDWGAQKVDAWLWGIIVGWDDDDSPDEDAMGELAARHGWDEFDVENLRALHRDFLALVRT